MPCGSGAAPRTPGYAEKRAAVIAVPLRYGEPETPVRGVMAARRTGARDRLPRPMVASAALRQEPLPGDPPRSSVRSPPRPAPASASRGGGKSACRFGRRTLQNRGAARQARGRTASAVRGIYGQGNGRLRRRTQHDPGRSSAPRAGRAYERLQAGLRGPAVARSDVRRRGVGNGRVGGGRVRRGEAGSRPTGSPRMCRSAARADTDVAPGAVRAVRRCPVRCLRCPASRCISEIPAVLTPFSPVLAPFLLQKRPRMTAPRRRRASGTRDPGARDGGFGRRFSASAQERRR